MDILMSVVQSQAQSKGLSPAGNHTRGDIHKQPHAHECYIALHNSSTVKF